MSKRRYKGSHRKRRAAAPNPDAEIELSIRVIAQRFPSAEVEIRAAVALAGGEIFRSPEAAVLIKPPFQELTAEQIAAVKQRLKEHPWEQRDKKNTQNLFEWVRDNFGEFIPGLLLSHMSDDREFCVRFTEKVHREGLPDWLDMPSQDEVNLRKIQDPMERLRLMIGRNFHKEKIRRLTRKKREEALAAAAHTPPK